MSKTDQEYLRRARLQMQETANFLILCHDDDAWLRHVIEIAQQRRADLKARKAEDTAEKAAQRQPEASPPPPPQPELWASA